MTRETVETIALRPYRKQDLDAIFHLDELCFSEDFRFDRRSMRLFAEARNAYSTVAETQAGALIGFVIAHLKRGLESTHGYILTIDVAHEQRRSGLAGRLMAEAERQLTHAGATRIDLHVFVENTAAIAFYERLAYQRQGRVPGFYGKGIDAWFYSRELTQAN